MSDSNETKLLEPTVDDQRIAILTHCARTVPANSLYDYDLSAVLLDAAERLQALSAAPSIGTSGDQAPSDAEIDELIDNCAPGYSVVGDDEKRAFARSILVQQHLLTSPAAPRLVERKAQPVSDDDHEDFVTSLVHILETQQGDPEDDRYDDGRAEALRIWKRIQAAMPAPQARSVSDNGAVGECAHDWQPFYTGPVQTHVICAHCDLKQPSQAHGKREAVADEPQRLYEFLAHGDEDHREWLREACKAFFSGATRPAPVRQAPAHLITEALLANALAEAQGKVFGVVPQLAYVIDKLGLRPDAPKRDATLINEGTISTGDSVRAVAPAAEAAGVAVPASKLIVLSKAMREHLEEGISNASEHDLPNDPDYAFIQEAELLLGPIYTSPVAAPDVAAIGEGVETEGDQWYLQDTRSFVGNDVVWWALDGNGYTTDLRRAQTYSREDAFRQAAMRGCDRAWPKAYIDGKSRPAVDFQYIDHDAALAQQAAPAAEGKQS